MQAEGTLELVAELSVAFAGFTGLAGLLTRDREGTAAFWFVAAGDWLFNLGFITAAAEVVRFAAGLYLINLLWGLAGTALSFVRLTRPIWRSGLSGPARSE
jgi:hypothetical protein